MPSRTTPRWWRCPRQCIPPSWKGSQWLVKYHNWVGGFLPQLVQEVLITVWVLLCWDRLSAHSMSCVLFPYRTALPWWLWWFHKHKWKLCSLCLSSVGLPEVVIEKDPVAMATSNLRPCFWNGDFYPHTATSAGDPPWGGGADSTPKKQEVAGLELYATGHVK